MKISLFICFFSKTKFVLSKFGLILRPRFNLCFGFGEGGEIGSSSSAALVLVVFIFSGVNIFASF
jgi:hypothetical protein